MSLVRQGIDFVIALLGALAWSFAAFVLGARFVSPLAGGLLAVALLFSGLGLVIGTQLQERRMRLLTAGVCPRCRRPIATEHQHRRWEPARGEWRQPLQSWECAACGYAHSEAWPCPACPSPA